MKNKFMVKMVFLFLLIGLFGVTTSSSADSSEARRIVQRVETRIRNDDAIRTNNMQMILVDKNKSKRIRNVKVWRKDIKHAGKETQRIMMFFVSPADVKDSAFLTYDYEDSEKDDDRWLYLPALRKTKRIATADQSNSFMGSDFTFYDMSIRETDDFTYKLLKEDKVRGNKVWVIEVIPRDKSIEKETGYTKEVLFVQQDNYVVIRAIHWVKDGGYLKYFDVTDLKELRGIWFNMEQWMTTKKGNRVVHQTVLRLSNIKFLKDISDTKFTVRYLDKGL